MYLLVKMNNNHQFTVHLVSSASMNIFRDNTMASFRNQLAAPLELEGTWQVALESIIFPTSIKNVTSVKIREHPDQAYLEDSISKVEIKDTIREIPEGIYKNINDLLDTIADGTSLQRFNYNIDPITDKLTLEFAPREGISFEDEQIPSILGFQLPRDLFDYRHVGFKTAPYGNVENKHTGRYPVDIVCGSHIIFLYIDIIEHQFVGDVKAPVLKIIDTERRLKNGSLALLAPIQQKTFEKLVFKPLLFHNIQNIQAELRSETGKLVPFLGSGKVIVNLIFKRVN